MHSIKVNKNELINILEDNLSQHESIFERALIGYRKKAIDVFEKALEDARQGRDIENFIRLERPVNQSKAYKRVIGMLKMHIEDEIELDEQQYTNFVMDEWGWSTEFSATNSQYL